MPRTYRGKHAVGMGLCGREGEGQGAGDREGGGAGGRGGSLLAAVISECIAQTELLHVLLIITLQSCTLC